MGKEGENKMSKKEKITSLITSLFIGIYCVVISPLVLAMLILTLVAAILMLLFTGIACIVCLPFTSFKRTIEIISNTAEKKIQ